MAPTKFTLRFHDARNHEMLGVVADHLGVSKNQLAEEMLARELQAAALLLERDLTGTVALLRDYRREENLERDVAAFAEAEAYESDPLRSTKREGIVYADALGVAEAFSS